MRGGPDPRRGRSGRGAARCRSAGPLLLLLGAALGAGRGAGPAAAQDNPCPPGTVLVNVGGEGADPANLFVPLKELQAAAMGYVPGGVALGLDGSDQLAAKNASVGDAITLGFADRLCKAIPRQGETYVGLLSSLGMPRGDYSGGPRASAVS